MVGSFIHKYTVDHFSCLSLCIVCADWGNIKHCCGVCHVGTKKCIL